MLALGKAHQSIDNTPENLSTDGRCLILFLCDSLAVLWKDWPKDMKLNPMPGGGSAFSLSGKCPHCGANSVFIQVGNTFTESVQGGFMFCAALRCQGCLRFVLAVARNNGGEVVLLEHYPLGKPDDSVDASVPPDIAADFAEALRCHWVKSHKAAVAMCRRSVEATCKDKGAKGKDLYQRIEDLAASGIITEPMRRMAHRVRLTANRKLHEKPKPETVSPPDEVKDEVGDDLDTMREKDAAAMIVFTKELFHHIYAVTALLDEYDAADSAPTH